MLDKDIEIIFYLFIAWLKVNPVNDEYDDE